MCAHTQAHAQTLTTDRDQPRTASKPRTMFDEQPHKVQLGQNVPILRHFINHRCQQLARNRRRKLAVSVLSA